MPAEVVVVAKVLQFKKIVNIKKCLLKPGGIFNLINY